MGEGGFGRVGPVRMTLVAFLGGKGCAGLNGPFGWAATSLVVCHLSPRGIIAPRFPKLHTAGLSFFCYACNRWKPPCTAARLTCSPAFMARHHAWKWRATPRYSCASLSPVAHVRFSVHVSARPRARVLACRRCARAHACTQRAKLRLCAAVYVRRRTDSAGGCMAPS